MMRMQHLKNGTCRVTFELPAAVGAEHALLCGDFNNWSPGATPMIRRKDGSFRVTLALDPGISHRFRYFLDGQCWENDWAADAYEPSEYDGDDSVVIP
jgi:1,4-alpha-glucan branching enzyme